MSDALLKKNTIFISCASDMLSEVDVVYQVIDELNRKKPEGDGFSAYHWSRSNIVWAANRTSQEYIPRTSDDNVCAVICLLGEKFGSPLPKEFPFPSQEIELPLWVQFPWNENTSENVVPLTGTLFELLDAYQKQKSSLQNIPTILIYIKVNKKKFTQINLMPHQRNYGFGDFYRELYLEDISIMSQKTRSKYDKQIKWIDCFCENFLRVGGRPFICFGNADEGKNSCLEDLKTKLREDLFSVFKLKLDPPVRELKGLESYQPEDFDILFGRDNTIIHLLEHLKTLSTVGSPILVLSGKNGEGKSSVLRAGLIGRLAQESYKDFGIFNTVLVDSLTLEINDPLANLEKAINEALEGKLWNNSERFNTIEPETRKTELVAAVKSAVNKNSSNNANQKRRLFIGIDHLEELLALAENDTIINSSLSELMSTVKLLAENGLAWVVLVLSAEYLDKLMPYEPSLRFETEMLGRPGDADLRNILTNSFKVADVQITEKEISSLMSDITTWISKQEDPGPILPLVSVLMREIANEKKKNLQDELVNEIRKNLQLEVKPQNEDLNSKIEINSVINRLCERTWAGADPLPKLRHYNDMARFILTHDKINIQNRINEFGRDGDPLTKWEQYFEAIKEAAFNRLMRRLVVTGLRDDCDFKILRQCADNHDAVIKAKFLVDQMKKNRLLLQHITGFLRLAHISIIENWDRSKTWYNQEHENHLFIIELKMMSRKYELEKERGKPGRLLTDVQDIDKIEDLWLSWIDDEDLLPISYMRKCLINYFNPFHRPKSWKRQDGISRLNIAFNINDEELLKDYLNKIDLLEDKKKKKIIKFSGKKSGNTVLEAAVASGNLLAVKYFLELGMELDRRNRDGWTPLFWAASNGHEEIVKFLLENGADFNVTDIWGNTPLSVAFYYLISQMDYTEILKENKDKLDKESKSFDHIKSIRYLKDVGATLEGSDCGLLMDVCEKALIYENMEILDLLFDSGFSFDFIFNTGETLLIKVVSAYLQHQTEILLKYGVNPNSTEGIADPLRIASEMNSEEIVKILLDAGAIPGLEDERGMSALHYAAQNGNLQIISMLVEKGEKIDHVNALGMTPLLTAVCAEQKKIIQFLLGIENYLGMSHHQNHELKETVQFLLQLGATLGVEDKESMTALHYAVQNENLQIISMLVDKGEKIDHVNALGMTPLLAAVCADKKETVELLLQIGANPNFRTENSQFPIIKAAQIGNAQIIELLCKYKAQINIKDQRNMTALMYATWFVHTDAVKKLLEFNADKEVIGPDNMTATTIVKYGCGMSLDEKIEVLKLLENNATKKEHE